MGLFDNIIGTANDGEAATDMDTIIDSISKGKLDRIEEVEESDGPIVGSGGTGDDSKGASGDDTKDEKKKKGKKKDDTDEEIQADEILADDKDEEEKKEEVEILDITEIDIGGDMSVIDITEIEEIPEVAPLVETAVEVVTIEPVTDTISPPVTSETPPETPAVPVLSDTHPDTMPTEPVTSLLDITEPTPAISILDMGGTTDTPTVPALIVPDPIVPKDITPIATPLERLPMTPTPISGSLGDKIGGFADELRGLKAADEILLQEKQDAKKRLEDAKKAIEDAETAIDVEIQRIRDDEAAIDDTLASLKRR